MNIDKPRGSIRQQAQTTVPVTGDSTLVDDPVILVDSATALSGGQTTSIPNSQIKIKPLVYGIKLRINR